MDLTGDELAGVVDLFGTLSRAELRRAWSELAFKRGDDLSTEAADAAIDDAVASYVLLSLSESETSRGETEPTDDERLAVGPVAFPTLPDGAEDLPHIMDVPDREPDPERLARVVRRRFERDAEAAIEADDGARIAELLEVSYELDVWGPVDMDVAATRAQLTDAVE
jgi:hypothetical protein